MIPDLVVLALDYFRSPLRYSHLADPERPLPEAFDRLVKDFGVALAPGKIEATGRALGVEPEEIERATRFFLRQVLLSPRSGHYRVLGLSTNASRDAVRQHYQVLIRIFHPDRSIGDSQRNAAYTARLNKAYDVLKNPVTRRRYDRQLVTSTVEDRKVGRGRLLSQAVPSRSSLGSGTFGTVRRFLPTGKRAVYVVAGGMAAALVLALAISLPGSQPWLRANPERADASVIKPSYLRESPFGPRRPTSLRGLRPLPTGVEITGYAEAPGWPLIGVGRSEEMPQERAIPIAGAAKEIRADMVPTEHTVGESEHLKVYAEALIARLVSYYQAGNLKGFVELFTADAQVNDGGGKDLIRADYARYFAKVPARRLSISNLRWQRTRSGGMIGLGTYQVQVKDGRGGGWAISSGALLIELVPSSSGFKIATLFHR